MDVSNRFTGQVLDEDTGLYYYGSRFYDAQLGRFVQPDTVIPADPTTNSQALNRYSYVFNNPLKFTDPTGNTPVLDAGEMKKMQQEAEASKTITMSPASTDLVSTDSSSNSPANSSTGFQGSGDVDNNGSAGNKTKVGTKKTEAVDKEVTPFRITPMDEEYIEYMEKHGLKFLDAPTTNPLEAVYSHLVGQKTKEAFKEITRIIKKNPKLWRAWVKLQEKEYGRTWYTLGLGKAWKNDGEAYWVEVHGVDDESTGGLGYDKFESAELAAEWVYDTYNNDIGNSLPDAFERGYTIEVPYGPKK